MKTVMQVTNAMFEKLQVGKSYRFDGRVGRVVAKHTDGQGASATGWASTIPMITVKWKD